MPAPEQVTWPIVFIQTKKFYCYAAWIFAKVKRKNNQRRMKHAHQLDDGRTGHHGVKYHKFWMNEEEEPYSADWRLIKKPVPRRIRRTARSLWSYWGSSSDYASYMGPGTPLPPALWFIGWKTGFGGSDVCFYRYSRVYNGKIREDITALTLLRKHNESVGIAYKRGVTK